MPEPAPTAEFPSGGALGHLACATRVAAQGLLPPRLQHVLVLLSMAVGATALAATLFIGRGALTGLWRDLDELMGDRVEVYPDAGPDDVLLRSRPSEALTDEDLRFVRRRLRGARYVAPALWHRVRASAASRARTMYVEGVAPELTELRAYAPLRGRAFSAPAWEARARECLLTRSAEEALGLEPGEQAAVFLDGERFLVVGAIPDPPAADPRLQARAVVPYALARLLWGRRGEVGTLVVAWRSPEQMEPLVQELRDALDECRAPEAYYLSSSQFAIRKRRNIVSNLMVVGMAQAAFCILVAAIGIASVMLAHVVRRSREFAIRITMGASHAELALVVLFESVLLGLAGGLAGVLIAAVAAPHVCDVLASRIPDATGLRPDLSAAGALVPPVLCALTGAVAGLVPAVRASRLDVLSVLREE